ncbi:MAG: hypothetical protein KME10_26760 [Plectolyngbya sp. WJT66-NPBG17]|jgi:hypothetical protein|nr:hypothetical protein [Plectolyngbya sp. WJT66-NPBG17]
MISQWLQNHADERSISLLQLWQTQMPWVEIWLGLLLGGFELHQCGQFYESEVWITASHYQSTVGVD